MEPLGPGDPREVGGYALAGLLGEGGMGRVFAGRSPGGRAVAVKLIHPGYARDASFRRRFRDEVEAARKVGGFHTAPVVDADPDPETGPPWMVTAYIPGPTLADAVAEHGPLPAGSVLTLGAGLAEGLAAIHACGLVHRDLKPSNVILAADGPRVIDFGVAKALDRTAVTMAGAVVGTRAYMPPEQARGAGVGPAADVFSLGAVLAFAVFGEGPGTDAGAMAARLLAGGPPSSALPVEARRLIASCLADDPDARPGVAELLAALAVMRTGAAPSDVWLPRPVLRMVEDRERDLGSPPPGPDRRWFLVAAATAGAAALAGGGIWLGRSGGGPERIFGGGWADLFADRGIRKVLRDYGLRVGVNNLSGMDMTEIHGAELERYDFFLSPADSVTETVRESFRAAGHTPPNPVPIFEDRMVVLVHRTLLDCLAEQDIVRAEHGYHVFDVCNYLDKRLNESGWTWGAIGGPAGVTQKDAKVEVVSGAPCHAGGGDLFLSLLIHAHEKRYDVSREQKVRELGSLYKSNWPISSFDLLGQFFSGSEFPMAFVYEHDALKYLAEHRENRPVDYRLLYPDPGVLSKHMFVGRESEGGTALTGRLLTSPPVRRVMVDTFHLRSVSDPRRFAAVLRAHGLAACIRTGGTDGLLDPPPPSDLASFRPAIMRGLRKDIVGCKR
ncbi:serine/threonine-protein kinase [Actinomadura roseirufa]|uniref:serine/threonine-protein kinase n=1 Tax=Actinomadura roseirufa TaxID=2094049 RepID=UPI0010413642|nr:serine/threonine-protein kinase [Actinomadura roseirufa]